MIEYNI